MSLKLKKDIVLKVNKISKKFPIPKNHSADNKSESFWALKEIDFEVRKGQAIGIIGHNGAGKSTLLKILAEVLPPTSGFVAYKGTILSILDVGTGFHPELSGYKNIFLNASILGMKKQKISEKVSQIVEFSGIAEHIHDSVKNYSSGMYLRLALSIALFIDNDIILLDEVLSVGDIEFRNKAIAKIKEQIKEGKSCVMISHDLGAIIEICDECLLMDKGSVVDRGNAKLMVEKYYDKYYDQLKINRLDLLDHELCQVLSVSIDKEVILMNEPVLIKIKYQVKQAFNFIFFLKVNSFHSNVMIASTAFTEELINDSLVMGVHETICRIPPDLFNAGSYMIDLIIGSEEKLFIEYQDACRFKVIHHEWEKDKIWNSSLDLFSFRPPCSWTTIKINDNA